MQAARDHTPDLVRLFDSGSVGTLADNELLNRFVVHRDRLAFESLVSRLGPMVRGVCRRQLGDSPDLDDALQATFLVLIRRGATLGPDVPLGAWLHGVAVRVARQARKQAARRATREKAGPTVDVVDERATDAQDPDLRRILDEEIGRLPDRYRLPVVLCYLEGITHEEAARRLGWPLGSVKGRLARARSLLQSRLTRRGVAGGVGVGALAAGGYVEASIPAVLVRSTCHALLQPEAGAIVAVAPLASQPVSRLAEGALQTMIVSRLGPLAVTLGVSGVFLASVGVVAGQRGGPRIEAPRIPIRASIHEGPDVKQALPRKLQDESGVPANPPLNQAEREAIDSAREAFRVVSDSFRGDPSVIPAERVHNASKLLLDVELSLARNQTERSAAHDAHVDRMRDVARADAEGGHSTNLTRAQTRAYFALATLQAEQARSVSDRSSSVPKVDGQAGSVAKGTRISGQDQDAKSWEILAKLEHPLPMNFNFEQPLEDVLKYVKQATQGPNDTGIPIYVDPLGLQEADRTLSSTVSLVLEGVPLKHTLRILLRQLGLNYVVRGGYLCIVSEASMKKESALYKKQERVESGEMSLEELKELLEMLKLRKEALHLLEEQPAIAPTPRLGP